MPYRDVNWIRRNIEKRQFSHALSRRLENRHAIVQLYPENTLISPDLSTEIYKATYDNYITVNLSKSTLFGEDYDSKDPSGILATATAVRYFYSGYVASQRGELEQFSNLSIDRAIAEFYLNEEVQEFTFDFRSPGKIDFISLTMGALLVALAVTLASDDIPYQEILNDLYITNQGNEAPTELTDCVDILRGVMRSIGEKNYSTIQTNCKDAEETMGLSTTMRRIK